jgi:hypothetical protein
MTIQVQEKENDKPPSPTPRPAHPLRVAVLANIKERGKVTRPFSSRLIEIFLLH